MTNIALITSGAIFLIASLLHLARLILKTKVAISGKTMPMWTSVAGLALSLLLSAWMFIMAQG